MRLRCGPVRSRPLHPSPLEEPTPGEASSSARSSPASGCSPSAGSRPSAAAATGVTEARFPTSPFGTAQGIRGRSGPLRHDQPPLGEQPREGADAGRLRQGARRHARGRQPKPRRRPGRLAAPRSPSRGEQRDPVGAAAVDAPRVVHPSAPRGRRDPGAGARRGRRADPRRRGDVPPAERRCPVNGRPERADRRALAEADAPPVRDRAGADKQQLRDAGRPGRRADADRPQPRPRTAHERPGHAPRRQASGVYAVRLEGPSGHKGFAPLIVRPAAPTQRAAVVIPTTTWHAYNYYDHNGDGFGDTWYSLWAQKRIDLTRPHLRAGVPERWRSYDLQFLHWLTPAATRRRLRRRGRRPLPRSRDAPRRLRPDRLPRPHRVRDETALRPDPGLPGPRRPAHLPLREQLLPPRRPVRDHAKLIGEWRDLGRPGVGACSASSTSRTTTEAAGAIHRGRLRCRSWAFAGTGLRNGSTFGRYGIEVDGRTLELAARGAGARDDPGSARLPAARPR